MRNLSPLSIPETEENALKRSQSLSESHTENTKKSGSFCKFISPAVFEPVSAAQLLVLKRQLLAIVLQVIEQFNQRIPK